MAVYLITYDLNKETKRPPIVDKIKAVSGGNWARLSESCYAISHFGTPEQVYGEIKPLIDRNDFLYIITLKKPYTGFGPKDVNDWLEANLTY